MISILDLAYSLPCFAFPPILSPMAFRLSELVVSEPSPPLIRFLILPLAEVLAFLKASVKSFLATSALSDLPAESLSINNALSLLEVAGSVKISISASEIESASKVPRALFTNSSACSSVNLRICSLAF